MSGRRAARRRKGWYGPTQAQIDARRKQLWQDSFLTLGVFGTLWLSILIAWWQS
jgi:hypothetical protein